MAAINKHSPQKFLSKWINGGARNNRFMVEISFPPALNVDGNLGEWVQYACHATSLPESTQGVISNADFYGRNIKLPGDKTFGDWTCSFYNDEDHQIRNLMLRWSELMLGHKTNVSAGLPTQSDYFGAAKIYQENNRGGGSIGNIVEVEAFFPTNIAAIPLSWADNNTIQSFEVTFAMNWFGIEGVTDGVTE